MKRYAKILIGTNNSVKINAVKEIRKQYSFLNGLKVEAKNVKSGVNEQPKSLGETIRGAINRAKRAYTKGGLSFGIEDGIARVPYAKTKHMNFCVCALYDGDNVFLGISSGFEYPKEATRLVFEEGIDINEAFYRMKLTKSRKIGNKKGAIGILTKNRLNRKELVKQAVMMAVIEIENIKYY